MGAFLDGMERGAGFVGHLRAQRQNDEMFDLKKQELVQKLQMDAHVYATRRSREEAASRMFAPQEVANPAPPTDFMPPSVRENISRSMADTPAHEFAREQQPRLGQVTDSESMNLFKQRTLPGIQPYEPTITPQVRQTREPNPMQQERPAVESINPYPESPAMPSIPTDARAPQAYVDDLNHPKDYGTHAETEFSRLAAQAGLDPVHTKLIETAHAVGGPEQALGLFDNIIQARTRVGAIGRGAAFKFYPANNVRGDVVFNPATGQPEIVGDKRGNNPGQGAGSQYDRTVFSRIETRHPDLVQDFFDKHERYPETIFDMQANPDVFPPEIIDAHRTEVAKQYAQTGDEQVRIAGRKAEAGEVGRNIGEQSKTVAQHDHDMVAINKDGLLTYPQGTMTLDEARRMGYRDVRHPKLVEAHNDLGTMTARANKLRVLAEAVETFIPGVAERSAQMLKAEVEAYGQSGKATLIKDPRTGKHLTQGQVLQIYQRELRAYAEVYARTVNGLKGTATVQDVENARGAFPDPGQDTDEVSYALLQSAMGHILYTKESIERTLLGPDPVVMPSSRPKLSQKESAVIEMLEKTSGMTFNESLAYMKRKQESLSSQRKAK